MFNEIEKICTVNRLGGREVENRLSESDVKFITGIFSIDDIISVEIDMLENEDFSRYYIKISENAVFDIVQEKVNKLYMDITTENSNSGSDDWDVIDEIVNSYDEIDKLRHTCIWLTRKN